MLDLKLFPQMQHSSIDSCIHEPYLNRTLNLLLRVMEDILLLVLGSTANHYKILEDGHSFHNHIDEDGLKLCPPEYITKS